MSEADDPTLNLTGAWNGLYTYPRAIEPTPFTATLSDTDGWLAGTTEEIARVGDAQGKTITATLQGRRTGRSITFLKTYDGMPHGYDTVHYAGDLNHDGTEIEGRWIVPGSWSGKFLMIRASGVGMGLVREVKERAQRQTGLVHFDPFLTLTRKEARRARYRPYCLVDGRGKIQ